MTPILAASSAFAIALAVVVGFLYLLVLRLVDLNEKEPAWALGLSLLVGGLVGALLPSFVSSSTLVLEPFEGALAVGVALALGLAVVLVILEAIGRLRGWSEVNGALDGIVYGGAVGLGLATGLTLVSTSRSDGLVADLLGISTFDQFWTTALVGLFLGLLGGIVGAGAGGAFESNARTKVIAYPLAGVAAAVLLGWLHELAFDGTRWGGEGGIALLWTGLLIPVVIVACVAVIALTREKGAIAAELAGEVEAGLLSEDDLRLLTHPGARRSKNVRHLLRGDLDLWATERAVHNRAVQLALVERRSRRLDGTRRIAAEEEASRLRTAIAELRGGAVGGARGGAGPRHAIPPRPASGRTLAGVAAGVAVTAVVAAAFLARGDQDAGASARAAVENRSSLGASAADAAKSNPKVQRLLRKLAPARAGQFARESVVRYNQAIGAGALGAIQATYRDPAGSPVLLLIAAWRSSDSASWHAYTWAASTQADGWILTDTLNVVGQSGAKVGTKYVLQSGTDVQSVSLNQLVSWSHRELSFLTIGRKPLAYDLSRSLPY